MNTPQRVSPAWLLAFSLVAFPGAAQEASRCGPEGQAFDRVVALDLESLLEMKVITASKFAQAVSDAPGVISVVSHDELRRFGGVTLREVLERVPGLSGTTAYFTDRSLVAARGDQTKIDGGHLLILINGRPTREILEGGLVSDLLESFPVSALEQVEVVKGPGSVLYGSNAFSAVINLITRKANRSGYAMSGLSGRPGGLVTSADATFRCGDLSVVGSAQFHRKPDWETTYRVPAPLLSDPIASTSPVQQISIPDRGAGAYLGVDYKKLKVMSSFTGWRTSAFVRGTVGENQWKRGFVDAGYTVKARENWDASLNLTYTRNTFDIQQYPSIGRDSSELVFEWTNTITPATRDRITFGSVYSYVEGNEQYFGLSTPITISNGQRSNGAWYAQADHRLTDTVLLVGGAQANKMGTLALKVVPRAGVIWNPAPRFNVKVLYSEAFRAPSINETSLNHPGLTGNPNLSPEGVGTLDLAVRYEEKNVQAGVSYFHSRQTDDITVDTSGARWRYVNLGGATFQGVEGEGKYHATRTLFLLGSFLYQTSDGLGSVVVSPVANVNIKAGLSYEPIDGLNVSVFDSYSGAVTGYRATLNPAPGAHHLVNGLVRFDLSKYWAKTSNQRVSLVIDGENLTNSPVWLPDWGGNTGDTIPAVRGRTIYVGIELQAHRNGHVARRAVDSGVEK